MGNDIITEVGSETVDVLERVGSLVFESAIVVMGLPEQVSRPLLSGVLSSLNIEEEALRIEVLGLVMPQIDSRLRSYLSPSETGDVMHWLQALIIDWDVVEPS